MTGSILHQPPSQLEPRVNVQLSFWNHTARAETSHVQMYCLGKLPENSSFGRKLLLLLLLFFVLLLLLSSLSTAIHQTPVHSSGKLLFAQIPLQLVHSARVP